MDKRIMEIAKKLDISYAEAEEMLAEDKKVDRMTKAKDINGDLDDKQRKTIKKYTNVARGKQVASTDAYGKKKTRTIKADDVKQMLIKLIAETLENSAEVDSVNITNIQKTIAFKIGDDDFEIDLKRKRKPKA
jgi:hypothetical protein